MHLLIVVYASVILSVFLVTIALLGLQIERYRYTARLSTEKPKAKTAIFRTLLKPMFSFTQIIISKTGLETSLRNKLNAMHSGLAPKEFFAIKVILMIGLCVLAYNFFGKLEILTGAIALVTGYFAPDYWLKRQVAKRRAVIAMFLPETIDLIGLCVEAGLDFTTAVRWIVEKTHSNPLVEELAFVVEEIKWGKPRTQALKDMSKRLNIREISSFVQSIIQAERMGTPVAETFVILSEDSRAQRFETGERFALKAPIKMLLPLIFILLVIMIVIMGPIFIQFFSQNSPLANF